MYHYPGINYVQYKRRCAVQVRYIFSTSEDVQYRQGILAHGVLLNCSFK